LTQIDYWLACKARNSAAYSEHLARALGKYWAHWDDVWAVDRQASDPIPNAATLLRPLDVGHISDLVNRVSQFYAERSGGAWLLWSAWPTPDLQPWDFQLFGQLPLMVRPPGGIIPSTPDGLRLVEVSDAATLADYERAFIDGMPLPELQPVRTGSLLDARVLGGPLRFWLGYLGDRAVTTARSYVDTAVNGIFAVTTLPEVRGHGYGTAITAMAIAATPSLPAVLEATDLGYAIYRRLGFTEIARHTYWLKPRA
jgi:GNAT superfamily N-acetyltransferase